MLLNQGMSKAPFVGRTFELQRLQYFLGLAKQGSPQICFLIGEAGSGKTTLVEKFLSELSDVPTPIIYATGECGTQIGLVDPYLPFKTIIQSFVKKLDDVKEKKHYYLKDFARLAAQTIIELAPDLIGNLLPGGLLLSKGLDILIEKSDIGSKVLADQSSKQFLELKASQISQHEICHQYASFLQGISKKYPIVLVIEDLHWADQSSINLLFYLSRILKEGQILIVGTYRPEDIKISVDGSRHPLESVINEIQRYRGDVIIDLNLISDKDRLAFINELIEVESNELGQSFRDRFFALTEGNALFATEMLYYMKENGYLQKDNNKWVAKKELNWNQLPTRVEAVIKERVDRVGNELKKALTIASVEGENFTAQVVGRLQEVNDGQMLERLSSQLDKRHHLVEEDDLVKIEGHNLALFKFSHSLIQQYLYHEIGVAERQLLHNGVAEALEVLYGENKQVIASQLARHYEEANVQEKAAYFYVMAGDKALTISAFQEAKIFFEQAIKLGRLEELGVNNRKLGIACYGLGLLDVAKDAFNQSVSASSQLNNLLSVAESEAWLGRIMVDLGRFESAKQIIEHGLSIVEASDAELFAHLLNELAYVDMGMDFLDVSEDLNRKSLEICEGHGFTAKTAKVLYDLGCCMHVKGRIAEAIEMLNNGIAIAQSVKYRSMEAYCLNELGWINFEIKDYKNAIKNFDDSLLISNGLDNKWLISESLNGLGFCNCLENNLDNAEKILKQALRIGFEINGITETLLVFVGFANLLIKKDDIQGAYSLIKIALDHPSSDYEIKHFARIALSGIENSRTHYVEIQGDAEVAYQDMVKKILGK